MCPIATYDMSAVVKNTPVEAIPKVVEGLRASFLTGKSRSVEYRKKQLKQLYFLVKENETAFVEAIKNDLGRPPMETEFGEIVSVKNEIADAISHVDEWAKPTKASGGLAYFAHTTKTIKDPKGTVLVLGAWNYPITVQIGPVVGALAAGNMVVLKPSELSAHSAQLIADLWPRYMDPELTRVVNGGVEHSTALLDQRFEHIFYTGSGRVGRIIAEKAAKWLCPTTLELGGKSPVIIDHTADLAIAAHRLVWAKAFNAGQTCIAPDYVLIDRSVQDKFVAELQKAAGEFWPSMDKNVRDFGRIVNERNWNRLASMLRASKGQVVYGGVDAGEESSKFLPLTILKDVDGQDSTMAEEIFGPILPLVPVDNVQGAADFINARDQPLALYLFAAMQPTTDFILKYTRSGAAVRGDFMLHFSINELPFGGTGPSGYGTYHGKAGFDCFTHERAFVDAPASGLLGSAVEHMMSLRYPPYSATKLALLQKSMNKVVFFGHPKNPTVSPSRKSRL